MAAGPVSVWGSLPHMCLLRVFEFLTDRERRNADMVCHHWHNVMRFPSLWRSRYFYFTGRRTRFRWSSEYSSAMTYAKYLGVHLRRLEVCVRPPRSSLAAQQLEQVITGLLSELIRVRAPLHSLSLVRLELDRPVWLPRQRRSLISCLIHFLRSRASKLTSVCLRGMQNRTQQGLQLLSALSYSQQRLLQKSCLSFLCLDGFFSVTADAILSPRLPGLLSQLQGLTELNLSYSCVSDQLLMALQERDSRDRNSGIDLLQSLSLHCASNEPHEQLVLGESWAALASRFPDLKVKLTVDQIISTRRLAGILHREIPLTRFLMTAFYSSHEHLSARPLLRNLLPQYRHSLQYLNLDLINYNDSLDEELLELVSVCEHLEKLRLWAFLEITTVGSLLEIRLDQRHLLNNIKVKIYTENDIATEQRDELEEMLSSYHPFPPELQFVARIYPFA